MSKPTGTVPLNPRKPDAGAAKVAEELAALSNDLAAKSRIVRKLAADAEAHERALAALQNIDSEAREAREAAREERRTAARAAIDPLIAKGKDVITRNEAARAEARPFVDALLRLDRKSIFERTPDRSLSQHLSTHGVIGLAFREAENLVPVLAANDLDLQRAIDNAESVTDIETQYGRAALVALTYWIDRTAGAEAFVRSKVEAIEKLLASVEADAIVEVK